MNEIIKALASLFSEKFNKKLKRAESLEELIAKLQKKQKKLKNKLELDLPESEHRLYQSQLTVLQTQLEKAQKLQLQESKAEK